MSSGVLRTAVTLACTLGALALPATAGAVVPGFNGYLAASEEGGQITIVTPAGGSVAHIDDPEYPTGNAEDPAWAPGGGKLVFRASHSLWLANPDGSGATEITGFPAVNPPEPVSPTWSPDGNTIAFVDEGGPLYTINKNGTGFGLLLDGKWWRAAWSPDGTKIALAGRPAGSPGTMSIYVVDSDGSDLTLLTDGREPAWSPDGLKLAFTRELTVYTMNANGTGVSPLRTPARAPAWSPDGTLIAFARGDYAELGMIKPDGTGYRAAGSDLSIDGYIDWQPIPISLQADKTLVDYGQTIVFTARFAAAGTPPSAQLKLYATPRGGAKTFLGQNTVSAGGSVAIAIKPAKRTKYVLEWAGDGTHAAAQTVSIEVKVRAVVELALYGRYRRSGQYSLFHLGKGMGLLGRVLPKHSSSYLKFEIQRRSGGRWSNVASDTFKIRRNGLVAVVFFATRTGTYRARTTFASHDDHLGAYSDWRYAKITR